MKKHKNAAIASILAIASVTSINAVAADFYRTAAEGYPNNAFLVDNLPTLPPGIYSLADLQAYYQSNISIFSAGGITSFQQALQQAIADGAVIPVSAYVAIEKQANRSLTTSIQSNIMMQLVDLAASGGSSGDAESSREFNVWATPNYTSISSELGAGAKAHTDMYQVSFGGDTKSGNFIYGFSSAYNRSNSGVVGSDDYRITPYAAYSFNKHLYATGIAGYSRSNSDTPASNQGIDRNGVFTDMALSYIQPINETILVGKVGHRFTYSVAESIVPHAINNAWDNTYYVGGDLLHKVGDFLPYMNVTWEHLEPEKASRGIDSAFLRLGLQYSARSDIAIGASYQTELTGFAEDNQISYHQAQIDLRVRF